MSVVFVEVFHLGRFACVNGGRWDVPSCDGVLIEELLIVDNRDELCLWLRADTGAGRADNLRFVTCKFFPLPPTFGERDLALRGTGVCGSKPKLDMMTEDGGELPGVSRPLAMVDLSFDSILETESLSCWLFQSICISSTTPSISAVCFFNDSHRACKSA